jgi:molybdopterin-guanine dinucleotide biosynthesis protein A
VDRTSITGLILAGGRGSRMGGQDKGLQRLAGEPLVRHAMQRLAPQVGSLLISANRNLQAYAAFGAPVVQDAEADFQGPLAGVLAGLRAASTAWVQCVPCDAPLLPPDLVARLGAASPDADIVLPCSVDGRVQPLFALLRRDVQGPLAQALARRERKAQQWMRTLPHRLVPFDRAEDERAFLNINSAAELLALQTHA